MSALGDRTGKIAAIPAVVAALVLGCGLACGPGPADRGDRPTVAVSIPPLAWFVERLAGPEVEVVVLLPPGANPEQFEPSMRERRALAEAALLVEVGHPEFAFETARIAPLAAERPGLPVVRMHASGADPGPDPHVWLSPAAAPAFVDRLADALAAVVPGTAGRIEAGRAGLREEVERLDADLERVLAPFAGRRFYVFHPGWGAFAQRYGLIQEAAEEHGTEPGADHLAHLIDVARRDEVRTVFVQPQFAEAGIRTLAAEIGADVRVLDPLAPDWDANLRRAAEALAASFRDPGATTTR